MATLHIYQIYMFVIYYFAHYWKGGFHNQSMVDTHLEVQRTVGSRMNKGCETEIFYKVII